MPVFNSPAPGLGAGEAVTFATHPAAFRRPPGRQLASKPGHPGGSPLSVMIIPLALASGKERGTR